MSLGCVSMLVELFSKSDGLLQRMENLCSKMVNDPKRQSPGIVPGEQVSSGADLL